MPRSDTSAALSISVVVCSLPGEPLLEQILKSLNESSSEPEIIVATPSTDQLLQSRWRDVIWVTADGGRAAQLNAGASVAQGEILWLLHSDSQLPENAIQKVESAFSESDTIGGAFRLRLDARGFTFRLIEWSINLRTKWLRMPYGDQGIFLKRSAWIKMGGFRDLDIMEDADLVQRARKLGRWTLLPARLTTSARRWEANGVVRTTAVNFVTQMGYILGISHARLRKFYDRHLNDGRMNAMTQQTRKRTRFIFIAAVLLIMITTGVVCHRDIARTLFGPVAVQGEEQYEANDDAITFDHSQWNLVLRQFVGADGSVDYDRLKETPEHLDRYIAQLKACNFDEHDRNGKLALLINGYNAFTMRLILDYYPLKSIRDIPKAKRWIHKRWHIGSLHLSLDEIENDYLRKRFDEPRIHFAINCGSEGCPPLRNEAFDASRIEGQLQDQTVTLHADGGFASYDPSNRTLSLNSIYDWYKGDFTKGDNSILNYAAQFMPSLAAALKRGEKVTISWKSYDWGLNKTP